MSDRHFLLDTCVILFTLEATKLLVDAEKQLQQATNFGRVIVSPISAWEIGKLVGSGKLKLPIDPLDYFNSFANRKGISVCSLSPEVLVRSSMLPELTHKDPMDCILIATARIHNFTLVTSDRAILAYGALGHVKTLAC